MAKVNICHKAPCFYASPIAGLQLDTEQVSIAGLQLVKLDKERWATVEREHVYKQWHATYAHLQPVFVFHRLQHQDKAEKEIQLIDKEVSRLISALRLHKYGVLHDPIFTARFLKIGLSTHRRVGPYREKYLTSPQDGLVYPLSAAENETVEDLFQLIKTAESSENADTLLAVINSFNLSFLATLSGRFRLSLLYTALEMVFSVSPKLFAQESETYSSIYQRAFAVIEQEHGPIDKSDSWHHFFCHSSEEKELEVHKIRKIVHHLKTYDAQTHPDQAVVFLQEALRVGIKSWLKLQDGRQDKVPPSAHSPKVRTAKEQLNLGLHRLWHGQTDSAHSLFTQQATRP